MERLKTRLLAAGAATALLALLGLGLAATAPREVSGSEAMQPSFLPPPGMSVRHVVVRPDLRQAVFAGEGRLLAVTRFPGCARPDPHELLRRAREAMGPAEATAVLVETGEGNPVVVLARGLPHAEVATLVQGVEVADRE